jgi:uncharacterized protein (TIGR02217 family)
MTITPYVPAASYTLLPRGNLLLQSQTFDNASWIKTNVTVAANATTDVWGLTTVDLVTRSSTAAAQISQAATKSAAAIQTMTLSFDAKPSSGAYLAVRVYGSSTSNRVDAIFNLGAGALVSVATTGAFAAASALIAASGVNGLFNCSVTFTTDAAATATVAFSSSSVSQQVDGTGSSNATAVYLSQAQLEPYSSASAYAATTTSSDPGVWAGTLGLPVLPYLPGQTPVVTKAPQWSTQVIRAASGRERRTAYWPYPLWQFELQYEVVRHKPAVAELFALWEFFNVAKGQFAPWLFVDPSDCQVLPAAPASFGTGDGSTRVFQLQRQVNSFTEPVFDVYQPVILDNAAPTASAYTISANGVVTFATAPASGHALTWFGYFYFGCRFLQDDLSFEQIVWALWSGKSLKFTSIRA